MPPQRRLTHPQRQPPVLQAEGRRGRTGALKHHLVSATPDGHNALVICPVQEQNQTMPDREIETVRAISLTVDGAAPGPAIVL